MKLFLSARIWPYQELSIGNDQSRRPQDIWTMMDRAGCGSGQVKLSSRPQERDARSVLEIRDARSVRAIRGEKVPDQIKAATTTLDFIQHLEMYV